MLVVAVLYIIHNSRQMLLMLISAAALRAGEAVEMMAGLLQLGEY